eukprot:7521108-Lingulodinium_polyedra.AAC.1
MRPGHRPGDMARARDVAPLVLGPFPDRAPAAGALAVVAAGQAAVDHDDHGVRAFAVRRGKTGRACRGFGGLFEMPETETSTEFALAGPRRLW